MSSDDVEAVFAGDGGQVIFARQSPVDDQLSTGPAPRP